MLLYMYYLFNCGEHSCLEDDVKIDKIMIAVIYLLWPSAVVQGLTIRFQARGPKRSFDKNKWPKTAFRFINHTIFGP